MGLLEDLFVVKLTDFVHEIVLFTVWQAELRNNESF